MDEEMKYVVDTSVVIERSVCDLIKKGKISGTILIPRAVYAELEHQANEGQEIGHLGLDELEELQKLAKAGKVTLQIVGERPIHIQIVQAKTGGEIDAMIARVAYDASATLITADKVQASSARAAGVTVLYLSLQTKATALSLEKYFDATTMSVHLKEDCPPFGKRGVPGGWSLVTLDTKPLTHLQLEEFTREIIEKSRVDPQAFIEIARPGSTIVQYRSFRIVIVRPPVSDGLEITVVKPIKQLSLDYYNLPESIKTRLQKKARGILVAGETGSGKSTFSQSLAEYYAASGFITKTVESPRDLILSPAITQYSKNFASSEEIHDILFLSRPDYIIFDEVRDTPDFKLYTDLRLGGSNVLGVLHAATAIDAINRFIGRLDTGTIPSVLDTIIFIDKGNVGTVLTLEMTVKVPSGMTEADLARPVVVVHDFISNTPVYEIYSYGEQTVVIPISQTQHHENPTLQLAARQLETDLLNYVSDVSVKMVSDRRAEIYVPADEIARLIGKQGKNIERVEKQFGISLDVKELERNAPASSLSPVTYTIKESSKYLALIAPKRHSGKTCDVYVDDHFLFTSTLSKKGEVKVHKKSKLGEVLVRDMDAGKTVELRC